MTEHVKPDLSTIEPLGRVPDTDDEDAAEHEAGRIGRAGAAVSNAPLAVGIEADVDKREREAEPRTSPETEEQLEQLRRG
jgi:hypothetical protein